MVQRELVLIIDFGGNEAQLLAQRVRELKVYAELVPPTVTVASVQARKPKGIIFSGGPTSVLAPGAPTIDRDIFELGIPVLCIGYGHQLMAQVLGGTVFEQPVGEDRCQQLTVDRPEGVLTGWEREERGWFRSGARVVAPPPGFSVLAHTAALPVAVMADLERHLYGVGFQPQVAATAKGVLLLRAFLFDICRLSGQWNMGTFAEEAMAAIRTQVGTGQVICGLSGGVDSSVAATLVHRAVGDQLTSIFVDHGLMRQDEPEQVMSTFRQRGFKLIYVDARQRFLTRLAQVSDPEKKRKIIGEEFIRVFEQEAERLGQVDFLVQGTVYPDVIESGSGSVVRVKSHHNVGGLPEKMDLKLIEPLRFLFKDEVRRLGEELGLPAEMVWRHPFPGPGLAVRVLGEVTAEKLAILRAADAIVIEEIKAAGLYRKLWQVFAVLPDIKSVGVTHGARTYAYTVGIRAVESTDAMTAQWAELPYEVLDKIAQRLTSEVPHVNRVVYDITSKPPATIEWE